MPYVLFTPGKARIQVVILCYPLIFFLITGKAQKPRTIEMRQEEIPAISGNEVKYSSFVVTSGFEANKPKTLNMAQVKKKAIPVSWKIKCRFKRLTAQPEINTMVNTARE